MRLGTQVEVDPKTGEWKIKQTYDEGVVLRECKRMRDSMEEGRIHDGKAKKIAMIPRHRFATDFELMQYQQCQGKDSTEASKWLNIWLAKNPEFRTTNTIYSENTGKIIKSTAKYGGI